MKKCEGVNKDLHYKEVNVRFRRKFFFCLSTIVGFQVASGFDHVRVILALTGILYAHAYVLIPTYPSPGSLIRGKRTKRFSEDSC